MENSKEELEETKEENLDSLTKEENESEINEDKNDNTNDSEDNKSKEDLAEELAAADFDKKFPTGFDIVALVGFILGSIALVASIFGFGIFTFLPGLIVSIVGKKAKKQYKLADYGILFSVLALIIAIAIFIFIP